MKKLITLFLIMLVFPFFKCSRENPVDDVELSFNDSKKASELIEADTKFGLDLFREVLNMQEVPENVMISPLSVAMALGMTYNGAEGTTKTAFEETLRLQGFTRDEINDIHKVLLEYLLKADPKVILEIANSIWYRQGFEVLQAFISLNQTYYQAEVNSLNFNDPSAKNIINAWVALKTHDKIKDIIDFIPPEAVMYLINAIYFNGTWTYEFKTEDTYTSEFTKEDQTVNQVQFMKMKADVGYMKNDLFSAINLNYGNKKFSMSILLPGEGKTITDIIDDLTMENYTSWMSGLIEQEVKVHLPKFKFGYKEMFNDPLADMGLGVAFTDNADFTGINPQGNLFISRVIHQSFIDVNEKGTEAAAATAVEVSLTSVGPEIPVFKANKPFIFIIREKASNAILFMGKVGIPEYE